MKFYRKYKPLLNLNDSQFRVIALTGGRGSGKTQHAIRGILLACCQKKKTCCFFRETQLTIANSSMAEAEQIIDTELKNRGFSYTQTEINHINGSKIFYKGLKEVNQSAIENLKGIASSTDFFFVDEAQSVSKAVWDVLIPTIRKKGAVLIVCYNRIKNDLPVEEALFLDYGTMTAPKNTYFIEVNYTELLHLNLLSDNFIERANLVKKNKIKEYEMIYLNRPPDVDDLNVVKYFSKDNIVNLYYQNDADLYLTWDFNVDPMSCICAHRTDDKVFYFDEFILENTTTDGTIKAIIQKYPNHKGRIIINGDASGDNRSTQSEWSNYVIIRNALRNHYPDKNIELAIRPFNPPIKNRILAFNNMIKDYEGKRHIFIDPRCEKLLYNMNSLKYKEGTNIVDVPTYTQIKTDKKLKFLEHPFDAASYLVEYYYPIRSEYARHTN